MTVSSSSTITEDEEGIITVEACRLESREQPDLRESERVLEFCLPIE